MPSYSTRVHACPGPGGSAVANAPISGHDRRIPIPHSIESSPKRPSAIIVRGELSTRPSTVARRLQHRRRGTHVKRSPLTSRRGVPNLGAMSHAAPDRLEHRRRASAGTLARSAAAFKLIYETFANGNREGTIWLLHAGAVAPSTGRGAGSSHERTRNHQR